MKFLSRLLLLSVVSAILISFSCSEESIATGNQKIRVSYLDSVKDKIQPLYDSLLYILPGDWLYAHDEKFVSFEDYRADSPVRPDEKRNVIYIQPFNDLDSNGKEMIPVVESYLKAFYGLKVVTLPFVNNDTIPEKFRRMRPHGGQVKTGWYLDELLAPNLPADAVVMIGLTGKDLYPGDSWNFVFGQAYLNKRVGVWSLARLCVSGLISKAEKKSCMRRLLNTAAHETGHMFSVTHCIKYKCVMNGSNSLEESDKKPTWLCPDCLCKFSWNLQREPSEHFTQMKLFWQKYNNDEATFFYGKNLKVVDPK